MLNVTKKVNIAVFMENVLINKSEKRTLKEPLSAKKSDVETRNDMNLPDNEKNFDDISAASYLLKGFLYIILWIVSTDTPFFIKGRIAHVPLPRIMPSILSHIKFSILAKLPGLSNIPIL
jgi:hypothetical protein